MQKPISCQYIPEHQTSMLFFSEAEAGEYSVRGAVCFPMLVDIPDSKDVFGYALLGCQDIHTGIVTIFEQQEFSVVDHIIRDNRIEHKGLSSWLNHCWSKYYGRKFYFCQDHELSRKYRLDIQRSVMVQPKPEMIEIEGYGEADMQHVIWSYIKTKRIVIEAGSVLINALKQLKQGDKDVHPSIYALQVLLCGMDRFPYRKKETAQ